MVSRVVGIVRGHQIRIPAAVPSWPVLVTSGHSAKESEGRGETGPMEEASGMAMDGKHRDESHRQVSTMQQSVWRITSAGSNRAHTWLAPIQLRDVDDPMNGEKGERVEPWRVCLEHQHKSLET